ncbi:MAG TPA: PaaI family thioesterase [Rhizomicrobium sp.]|jgi:uncharacterized protein (TIGR00369 family)
MSNAIPDGFERHFRTSAVTDPWEPLYSRRGEALVEIGMIVSTQHCNSRGFLHGGVVAALADNAMGLSFGAARSAKHGTAAKGAVTVTLALDYLATASIGQWMCVTPRVLRAGRQMGFADALITAELTPIARASATFRVIE